MGRPRQTHCIHGHKYTPANTISVTRANGVVTRCCKTCNASQCRLRYRNDEAYREYQKAKARQRYAKQKELSHGRTL